MSKYTYTIYDANPHTSSGTAWPTHQEVEIEAESDEDVLSEVEEIMETEAAGLSSADGYDVGQHLYALVWDSADIIVGQLTYALTTEDLT